MDIFIYDTTPVKSWQRTVDGTVTKKILSYIVKDDTLN